LNYIKYYFHRTYTFSEQTGKSAPKYSGSVSCRCLEYDFENDIDKNTINVNKINAVFICCEGEDLINCLDEHNITNISFNGQGQWLSVKPNLPYQIKVLSFSQTELHVDDEIFGKITLSRVQ
jgi:hypothetical protein